MHGPAWRCHADFPRNAVRRPDPPARIPVATDDRRLRPRRTAPRRRTVLARSIGRVARLAAASARPITPTTPCRAAATGPTRRSSTARRSARRPARRAAIPRPGLAATQGSDRGRGSQGEAPRATPRSSPSPPQRGPVVARRRVPAAFIGGPADRRQGRAPVDDDASPAYELRVTGSGECGSDGVPSDEFHP